MFKKKNKWLRFGCFLIGYNYALLMSCSEASKKAVKKFTSAILIIMILWTLIGFLFAKEYLQLGIIGSLSVGFVSMIIIIQIERQIILGSKSISSSIFRTLLGVIMALLGSIIIDQIIFKEDIQKEKLLSVSNEVGQILPQRINEINLQLKDLDSLIDTKQVERDLFIIEVTKKPSISLPSSNVQRIPGKTIVNGVERDTIFIKRSYSTVSIPNPKAKLIPDLDIQITDLRNQKTQLSNKIIDVRKKTEDELLESKGFLDELEIMFKILLSSNVSLFIWGLWIFFFLIIELFVLISKLTDVKNDYEVIIKHQMNVKIDAINKITNFE